MDALATNDVRWLFNHKAATWQGKYRPGSKLQARLERFTTRLEKLLLPPARILDLGCGTGDLAAALSAQGYRVTACDIAEKMLDVARQAYARAGVEWRGLDTAWRELPFAAGGFDGAVASSVFEYLEAVPGVASELARVLRPGGVLLLSVPNPYNRLRKVEAGLQSLAGRRLPSWLERIPRLDSYVAYLRLSRNRWGCEGWQTALSAANFAALDDRDFSDQAWRGQAGASLLILALKKPQAREARIA